MVDEGFRWEGQFYIPFEVIIEVFAADAAIDLIDAFHDKRHIR